MNLNTPYHVIDIIHQAASKHIEEYNCHHTPFMCNLIRIRDIEKLIQEYVCDGSFALVGHLDDVVESKGIENTKERVLFRVANNFWNDFVENKKLWSDEQILAEYNRLT